MVEVRAQIKVPQDLATLDQMVTCLIDDDPTKEDTKRTDETMTDTVMTTTALIYHQDHRSLIATLQATTGIVTVKATHSHHMANGVLLGDLITIVEDTTRDPQVLMKTNITAADLTTMVQCTSDARIASHLSQGKSRMSGPTTAWLS